MKLEGMPPPPHVIYFPERMMDSRGQKFRKEFVGRTANEVFVGSGAQ